MVVTPRRTRPVQCECIAEVTENNRVNVRWKSVTVIAGSLHCQIPGSN